MMEDNTMPHVLLEMPWESVGTFTFAMNNKHYLCIIDYHANLLS